MKKIKKFILIILLMISIVIPILIYLSIYKIDNSNMDAELGKSMNSSSLRVIKQETIDDFEKKYIVVYFEIGSSSGISVLSKGLNNKYQIRDTYNTDREITYVEYNIESESYNIIYGKSNKTISTLNLKRGLYDLISEDVNSENIFIIRDGLFNWDSIEIIYDNKESEPSKTIEELKGSSHKSSISREIVPLFCFSILVFVLFFSIIISSGREENIFDSDVAIDGDNRLKQMKPW